MEKKLLVLKRYGRKDFEAVCIEDYKDAKYQSLRRYFKFIITDGQARKIAAAHSESYLCGTTLKQLMPSGRMSREYIIDLMREDIEGCLRYKNMVAIA